MTGTTDLSVEQVRAIAALVEGYDSDVVRVVIHPELRTGQTVRVVVRSLSFGSVLEGYRYVTRGGEILTGKEYTDRCNIAS